MFERIKNLLYKQKFDSKEYWESRYSKGGNSGSGSYGHLATFKAEVLNAFVERNKVQRVIEYGCGDGNQLLQARYPEYIGLDVSPTAIRMCINMFKSDSKKSFVLYESSCFKDDLGIFKGDLALSLDVLFHLVENSIYKSYLFHLFQSSSRFVIIYSSDDIFLGENQVFHEKRRKFTEDIARLIKGWRLIEKIENSYKSKFYGDDQGSLADFYIYEKENP